MNPTITPADPERASTLDRVVGHLGDCDLSPDTCWDWQATIDQKGYGRIMRFGKGRLAHAAVWELLVGEVPKGLVLDHLCRNRKCVNPDHLEVVTNEVNVMRGEGIPARNARKTHCKWGHEFTPENTYLVGANKKGRQCKACCLRRTRERRAQQRAQNR